jgi:nitrite reductase (NADH) small subunit
LRHRIGTVGEVRSDGCRVVELAGRPVGVISVDDEFYAIHDSCPHMGASMCAGSLCGTFVAAGAH